jgi:hypothetical protein
VGRAAVPNPGDPPPHPDPLRPQGRRGRYSGCEICECPLAKAFGSTPEAWAGLQFDYDMAQAMKQADEIKVQRVPTPALGAE